MSKEEAERNRESEAAEQTNFDEPTVPQTDNESSEYSSVGPPGQQLAEAGPSGPNTLPIVDEAGEASSVGGHSQRSPRLDKELPLPPNHGTQLWSEKQNGTFQNGPNPSVSV